MPGKIFFSPNFFTSELCFTFLHQFSGTGYCCGEECDANLSLFFSFVHDLVLCLWKYFKLNKWIRSFLGLRLPYLIILIRIWGVIITLLSLAVLRNSLLASLKSQGGWMHQEKSQMVSQILILSSRSIAFGFCSFSCSSESCIFSWVAWSDFRNSAVAGKVVR